MTHEDYMRQALALAREAAAAGEVPVGCVIVRDGAVVGRGRNRREERQAAWSHAEMEAMAEANRTLGTWRLDGCTLYVCRGHSQRTSQPGVLWGPGPGDGGLRRGHESVYGGFPSPSRPGGRRAGGRMRPGSVGFFSLRAEKVNFPYFPVDKTGKSGYIMW